VHDGKGSPVSGPLAPAAKAAWRTLVFASAIVLVLLFGSLISSQPTPAAAQPEGPPISHPLEGFGNCLQCHDFSGIVPQPPSHLAYQTTGCLACHEESPDVPEPDTAAEPATAGSVSRENCRLCHSRALTMTLASGEVLNLQVDLSAFDRSVHGVKLACSDCHTRQTVFPHPKVEVATLREYATANYQVCSRCHFSNYNKTLDSVHYQALSQGDQNAPVCTDCHGSHDVTRANEPRSKMALACSSCHAAVYEEYGRSVHGRALQEENPDVPTCTTCHGVHNIHTPESAAFRQESVGLCGQCHANAELMDKYGISANVMKSYLNDFHGKTLTFYKKESSQIWVREPVCTDCHGVHSIQDPEDEGSIKANLLQTCQKCHPGATANFPSAWLSHYEPSLSKAPMVYLVKLLYRILIPFMIGGLMLHILLDIWRLARNR
jgi:hypothetical protein